MRLAFEMRDRWTFAELQAELAERQGPLDDIDWRRFEILDGGLVVSPSATPRHELVSDAIRAIIRAAPPSNTRIIGPIGVDLGRSYRIADLVVVPNRVFAADSALLDPADVLLAVEVVAPSSVTDDRITKPAQYAAAGIPAYWRVETDPEISVTAYVLDTGTYHEVGSWATGETARIEAPFAVEITVSELAPPSDGEPRAT